MPLLLEPKQRYAVVLDSDKDKPEDVRPAFLAFALSARESIANTEKVSEFKSDSEIFEQLKTMIVDWSNMVDAKGNKIEFDIEKLSDILTTGEGWELFGKINRNDFLSAEDKKK